MTSNLFTGQHDKFDKDKRDNIKRNKEFKGYKMGDDIKKTFKMGDDIKKTTSKVLMPSQSSQMPYRGRR